MARFQNLYNNRSGVSWVNEVISQNGNFNASVNHTYLVDTSSGPVVVTLPDSPVEGSKVKFIDKSGSFGTHSLTINRSGTNTISDNSLTSIVLDTNFSYLTLTYSNEIWIITSGNFFIDNVGITPSPIWSGTTLGWDTTGDGSADVAPVDLQGPVGPQGNVTSKRNTVFIGPDIWLQSGSGPEVICTGSAYGTIAKGFGANGCIDDFFEIPGSTSWNLPINSTSYLWVEWDSAITAGHSTLAPAYGPTAPTSPATGQWWFDTVNYKGFSWNGSAWVDAPRLYVGQATTDGSGVTGVVQYAYNGKAVVGGTVALDTNYNYNHNLGTTQCSVYGVFNNITGSSNTTFAPNGSGGFQIGIGYQDNNGSRFSAVQLQSSLEIRLTTGSFRLYEQPRGAGAFVFNFTGAESEIWVKRAF